MEVKSCSWGEGAQLMYFSSLAFLKLVRAISHCSLWWTWRKGHDCLPPFSRGYQLFSKTSQCDPCGTTARVAVSPAGSSPYTAGAAEL